MYNYLIKITPMPIWNEISLGINPLPHEFSPVRCSAWRVLVAKAIVTSCKICTIPTKPTCNVSYSYCKVSVQILFNIPLSFFLLMFQSCINYGSQSLTGPQWLDFSCTRYNSLLLKLNRIERFYWIGKS